MEWGNFGRLCTTSLIINYWPLSKGNKMNFSHCINVNSPLGPLLIQGNKTHIQYLKFDNGQNQKLLLQVNADWADACAEQLRQYFSGQLTSFDLPIDAQGTEFQKKVWSHLCEVRLGELRSYQQLALATGNIKAVRAVASANARNPIWLLIPCHRIIGSDNALRGYAGGIERKARLLQLEKHEFDCSNLAAINETTKILI